MVGMTGQTLIDGRWVDGGGPEFVSTSPSDGSTVWSGKESTPDQIDKAFAAARTAFGPWWCSGLETRIAVCEQFADLVRSRTDELSRLISAEMGKTLWESQGEAATVAGKIAVSVDALRTRRDTTAFSMGPALAVTRFKPHGVLAVLGPFNFPAHLPNGHIVPALLAGNTVVFKPSELAPAVGEWMASVWQEAGLPAGVLNVVPGSRSVGQLLVNHEDSDGLLFTGSSAAGRAIHQTFGKWPQKMLALEMGGNNPLVIHQASNVDAAAYLTVMSAFITSGQRCTCARRLILVNGPNSDAILDRLAEMTGRIRVGYWDDPEEPFSGTVVSRTAGERVQQAVQASLKSGAREIVAMKTMRDNPALLTPCILDVTEQKIRNDDEIFGPVLNVIRVPDFDSAIEEANNTQYGLAAGLISDSRECFDEFTLEIRAGIVNWNRQTTGASGKLPFGGCGFSGNHRPAGYYSADYAAWPMASLESGSLELPEKMEPGIQL